MCRAMRSAPPFAWVSTALVEQHAEKDRERIRVEELIGVWIAGDGEVSLHTAMIARDPIDRSRPRAIAR